MAYSMTGFGSAKATVDNYDIEVQVKTLNNRSLDVHVSMPNMLNHLEILFQRLVRQFMGRGRVDINVQFTSCSKTNAGLNRPLLDTRMTALRAITNERWSTEKCLEICLQQHDVWDVEANQQVMSERFYECVLETTRKALEATNKARAIEGKALETYFLNTLDEIDTSRRAALTRAPQRIEEYQKALNDRILDISRNQPFKVDADRIATEVALMADRMDVTEELTRIATHLSALRILILTPTDPLLCIGKKIDFYLQELNREATTMASKSRDSILTKHTIDIRTMIESVREQAANIQ